MRIAKEFYFSMGHTLHNYEGKCANLHGHNYQLTIMVESELLNEQGMVMDFGDIKAAVDPIIDKHYDHRFLIHENDPRADNLKLLDSTVRTVPWNPTAENLVSAIFGQLCKAGLEEIVGGLRLWETNDAYAEI
tara:strand:- start:18 stop:416 length:399 start_codon:yes stop_codon:yes gene_type:complete